MRIVHMLFLTLILMLTGCSTNSDIATNNIQKNDEDLTVEDEDENNDGLSSLEDVMKNLTADSGVPNHFRSTPEEKIIQDEIERLSAERSKNNRSKEQKEFSKDDLRKEANKLAQADEINKLETLMEENLFMLNDEEQSAKKSYLDFHNSDESISLRASKLMDEVDYGYVGVLDIPIEQAIQSPQEEGSIMFDKYGDTRNTGYRNADWSINHSKDAYDKAKNHKEQKVIVEVEKLLEEKLLEDAKGQNPHIGMTKAQVEVSLWGKPNDINRTVTQYRTREQWVYGNRQYLYFTDGILTSFQD